MTFPADTLRRIASDPGGLLAELDAGKGRQRAHGTTPSLNRLLNPDAAWWECWLLPARPPKGYATFSNWQAWGGTSPWAHRIVAAAVYGPIPEGHDVDHVCFTRNCVNPFHLRFLPASVNRGRTRARSEQVSA